MTRYRVWRKEGSPVIVSAVTHNAAKRAVEGAYMSSEVTDGWTPRAEWTQEGPCLVWLAYPMFGCRVHAAYMYGRVGMAVANVLDRDAPPILYVRPLPPEPEMPTVEVTG